MNVVTKRLSQVIYTVTALAGIKDEDIFLISFPKSGNTWVKFILLNILIEAKELKAGASFKVLDETIPELSRDNLMRPWKYKILPRFIKSHIVYRKLFFRNNKALFIVRDPRDVMVSYFHYVNNNYGYNFQGDFSAFIRHEKLGLEACLLHHVSWQNKAAVTIKYEDLKINGTDVLYNALAKLGINVKHSLVSQAFENATFENMQKLEQGPKKYTRTHKKEYNFMRKGTGNQWLDYFSGTDVDYYNALLKKHNARYINYYES
ncbi:sulfotransferase domain-containing protein [soil metagenome]